MPPKRAKPIHPKAASLPATPYRPSTDTPQGATPLFQDQLKVAFRDELASACWESPTLLEHLTSKTSPSIDFESIGRSHAAQFRKLVKSRDSEPAYYQPLMILLNAILESLRKYFTSKSYHYQLAFYVYDRLMLDGVAGAPPLKPDGVGLHAAHTARMLWFITKYVVEVKENAQDLLAQCATYARTRFAADRSLYFVPIISYRQTSNLFRFSIFDRAGAICTPEYSLRDFAGQMKLVQAVSTLLSWEGRPEAGYDPSRSNHFFALPEPYGLYKILEITCERVSLHGRTTRTYVLGKEDSPDADSTTLISTSTPYPSLPASLPPPFQPLPLPLPLPQTRVQTRSQTRAKARRPQPSPLRPQPPPPLPPAIPPPGPQTTQIPMPALIDSLRDVNLKEKAAVDIVDAEDAVDMADVDCPDESGCFNCSPAFAHSGDAPAEILVKDSYCLIEQPDEAAVYKEARGNFGLPIVHHGYSVHLLIDGRPVLNRTSRIRPDDAILIPFGTEGPSAGETIKMEEREHRRLILETVGKDLFHTAGPRQLIKCILHAIMGTFSLADKTHHF